MMTMNKEEAINEAILSIKSGDFHEAHLICAGLDDGNFDVVSEETR